MSECALESGERDLHLAGVVFRDEAAALEKRLMAGTTLYRSDPTSDDLSGSTATEQAAPRLSDRPS